MEAIADVRDAAALIAFALNRSNNTSRLGRYRELLTRYHREAQFHELVEAAADGLGLAIISTQGQSSYQLVLAANPGGVFSRAGGAFRTPKPSGDARDRILTGLIHVGIAITLYPDRHALAGDTFIARPAITAQDVHATITTLIETIEQRQQVDLDAEDADEIAELAAPLELYRELGVANTTSNGAIKRDTAIGRITTVLKHYEREHMMTSDDEHSYQATHTYQVHLQRFATGRLYELATQGREDARRGRKERGA